MNALYAWHIRQLSNDDEKASTKVINNLSTMANYCARNYIHYYYDYDYYYTLKNDEYILVFLFLFGCLSFTFVGSLVLGK